MCCSVLKCVAVYCIALHDSDTGKTVVNVGAAHVGVLQCVAVCCSVLHHRDTGKTVVNVVVANVGVNQRLDYVTLQHTVLLCVAVCVAVCCSVLQCVAVRCSVLPTSHCSTLQHIEYNTL